MTSGIKGEKPFDRAAYDQAYYLRRQDIIANNTKKWRQANPELRKMYADRNNRKINNRFRRAQISAGYRDLFWELTLEQYTALVAEPCAYCGSIETTQTGSGLDRQDRFCGYIFSNVVSCCKDCQHRKTGLEHAGFNYPRSVELLHEVLLAKP